MIQVLCKVRISCLLSKVYMLVMQLKRVKRKSLWLDCQETQDKQRRISWKYVRRFPTYIILYSLHDLSKNWSLTKKLNCIYTLKSYSEWWKVQWMSKRNGNRIEKIAIIWDSPKKIEGIFRLLFESVTFEFGNFCPIICIFIWHSL